MLVLFFLHQQISLEQIAWAAWATFIHPLIHMNKEMNKSNHLPSDGSDDQMETSYGRTVGYEY